MKAPELCFFVVLVGFDGDELVVAAMERVTTDNLDDAGCGELFVCLTLPSNMTLFDKRSAAS